jgi:hypothetical protein
MRKIGFTGTRHGMTEEQKKAIKDFFRKNIFHEFHHGDCVGSDKDAHDIIDLYRKEENKPIKIVGHPPKYQKYRANCKCDLMLPPDDYLTRNHNIVDVSDILVATPDSKEKIHSGTWSTIRYARKRDKKIYIFDRHGNLTKE